MWLLQCLSGSDAVQTSVLTCFCTPTVTCKHTLKSHLSQLNGFSSPCPVRDDKTILWALRKLTTWSGGSTIRRSHRFARLVWSFFGASLLTGFHLPASFPRAPCPSLPTDRTCHISKVQGDVVLCSAGPLEHFPCALHVILRFLAFTWIVVQEGIGSVFGCPVYCHSQ